MVQVTHDVTYDNINTYKQALFHSLREILKHNLLNLDTSLLFLYKTPADDSYGVQYVTGAHARRISYTRWQEHCHRDKASSMTGRP
jgi:hypothetical protein